MFGFGKKKKEHDVRLTEEELEELKKKMTRSERKELKGASARQKTTGIGMLCAWKRISLTIDGYICLCEAV